MLYVQAIYKASYEVKKSTFTSYLLPYAHFASYHDKLKNENPKASHIIWAFRRLNEHAQMVEGGSDDGEPKGVAATPTLNVLRGEALINVALLTVRYFGGTKLGTGGMVRAYTQSAKAVVSTAILEPYEVKESITFESSYAISKRYEHYFDKYNILYHDRIFHPDKIIWNVTLSKKEKTAFALFRESL